MTKHPHYTHRPDGQGVLSEIAWLRHLPKLRPSIIIAGDDMARQQYGRDKAETLVPHNVVDPDDRCQLDRRIERSDDHDPPRARQP